MSFLKDAEVPASAHEQNSWEMERITLRLLRLPKHAFQCPMKS